MSKSSIQQKSKSKFTAVLGGLLNHLWLQGGDVFHDLLEGRLQRDHKLQPSCRDIQHDKHNIFLLEPMLFNAQDQNIYQNYAALIANRAPWKGMKTTKIQFTL